MKVSLLIPVYNGERNLVQCLDSVLAQDFRDLEILVSDDHSSDDSVGIVRNYAARDQRIRWWTNSRNAGLTANSNLCLKAAQGDYIKFVHQDDLLLHPTAVSKLVAALDQNPAVSLAACRQHLVGTRKAPLLFLHQAGVYSGRHLILASLERNTNLIGQPSLTLFRREQATRGFDEQFTGMMDFELWCHLLEQGDFAYLAEDLATWRVHEEQQTARDRASRNPNLEQLRFMEIYYAKPWLRQAATGRMLFAQIHYLEKRYGQQAWPLTKTMRAQLGPGRLAWHWLDHQVAGPVKKLARKLTL